MKKEFNITYKYMDDDSEYTRIGVEKVKGELIIINGIKCIKHTREDQFERCRIAHYNSGYIVADAKTFKEAIEKAKEKFYLRNPKANKGIKNAMDEIISHGIDYPINK